MKLEKAAKPISKLSLKYLQVVFPFALFLQGTFLKHFPGARQPQRLRLAH